MRIQPIRLARAAPPNRRLRNLRPSPWNPRLQSPLPADRLTHSPSRPSPTRAHPLTRSLTRRHQLLRRVLIQAIRPHLLLERIPLAHLPHRLPALIRLAECQLNRLLPLLEPTHLVEFPLNQPHRLHRPRPNQPYRLRVVIRLVRQLLLSQPHPPLAPIRSALPLLLQPPNQLLRLLALIHLVHRLQHPPLEPTHLVE